MEQDEKGQRERNRTPFWIWLLYVFALWQFVKETYSAFHRPWTWTNDQIGFVFLALCTGIGIGSWSFIWWRGGTSAIKARWARVANPFADSSTRLFGWRLLFWILVAMALVFFFSWRQQRGAG